MFSYKVLGQGRSHAMLAWKRDEKLPGGAPNAENFRQLNEGCGSGSALIFPSGSMIANL